MLEEAKLLRSQLIHSGDVISEHIDEKLFEISYKMDDLLGRIGEFKGKEWNFDYTIEREKSSTLAENLKTLRCWYSKDDLDQIEETLRIIKKKICPR